MATILTFDLAKRRDPLYRPRSAETGSIVPFPGVRYERIIGTKGNAATRQAGQAAVTPNGKALFKPDF